MYKRILSIVLCIALIFTACSKNKPVINENEENSPVQETIVHDKYELTALKSDKQGIDNSTAFQLTSKDDINKNYVKDNLQLIPNQEYKVERISSTVYNVIPLSQLEHDKIYQVKLNDEDYVYSWAFQTKKEFKVESTIPADKSDYVPLNSGIEMYFSLKNTNEIDEYFEINPHVEGKFINNNNSVVFVPEQLEKNTIYTVTIKKGFGLEDKTDKLEEDYVFSFSTQKDINSQIYFERPIINIYENNVKIIDAYVEEEKEFNINIYEYKDSNGFAEHVDNFAETGNFPKVIDEKKLTLINTLKQKPYMKSMQYYRNALFELPNDLKKGYYLLEFNSDEKEASYLFLQINDMLIYNALFDNQILVFACDGKTSKEIKNAEVILNDEIIGSTNESGTLVYDKKPSDLKKISLIIKANGYNDFIYASSIYMDYYRYQNDSYNYYRYIDTDRPVYLPTDQVNVWGFARFRDNKYVDNVKIELVETNTQLVLDSKNVDLTDIGTYETQFDLNNITSEGLIINVYDNDLLVSAKYISVSKYTKPLYTLKGTLDKEFAYSGESINYKINANFFDGYPVPNLELHLGTHSYSAGYERMDEVITLNENGESVINLNTNVVSGSWRPVTISINNYNNKAEDTSVNVYDDFQIFPKHKMLEIERDINEAQSVNILFHELNIDNYKQDIIEDYYYNEYKLLRGNPIDDMVHVKVIERYHEKIKVGEEYDFINKVNEIKYDYKLIENTTVDMNVNTISGIANIKIPNFNEKRNYEVIAYYEDYNGGIKEESYVYGKRYAYADEYYRLDKGDDKNNYRLNDNVNLQLEYDKNDVENIENDNLFVMYLRNGLIDYTISSNTSVQTKFKENFIPNIMLYGVYVKNGYVYPVSYNDELYYDRTERQINLDVTTNKEEYLPGEEVTVNIKATDENNNPIVADVNISVVDEAYFAIFNKSVSTLTDLYMYLWDNGLRRSYLSNIDLSEQDVNAEKGGGGGNDGIFRDDFKDTNTFKTITTDKNGNGTLKFKLADNLTSWRITYQGISDKLYSGSGTKNITVKLPFYVDLIMGKEYLKEDKINAALRVFGTNVKESDQVEYKVTINNKETSKKTDYTATGIGGDYTNINLSNLPTGLYEIYVSAKSNKNEDGLKEEFTVVDSSVFFNNTDYYKLSDSTVLDEVYSNPVITLFNESTSDFYKSLNNISSSYGKRFDQTVSSMIASNYINEYFDADLYFSEEDMLNEISKYEANNGGIKLLSYSEPEVNLATKLVHVLNNDYVQSKLKVYLKNTLNADVYTTDISEALWGLSKYKEPILLKTYDLLENENLETRDKIYLSLTLVELGDNKTAKEYYKEFTDELKKSGDYLYYGNEESELDNYELTALLSILGVKLQDFETSDKLFKYICNKPSKYTLSNFEQLIYIMNRDIMKLDEIKDLFGEVTVAVDGTKKTYKLELFDRESFAVTKDKIKDIKFSNINGSIACKVEALGNKDDLEKNKTDDFSMDISYKLNGSDKEQTIYNHSDVVKVSIIPSMSKNAESGMYEITYVIPSGFRHINAGVTTTWGELNGQKYTFSFYYNKEHPHILAIDFYMQAAQTGEYTVDYAVIKEYLENKLNYVEKTALTVK